MKVIIAGGRDFNDMSALEWAIERSGFNISKVVSGACGLKKNQGREVYAKGADGLGEQWADANHVPFVRFYADWDTHGKAAGPIPIRNREMAEYAKAAIVLPGGKGSQNMSNTAAELGLKVFHVWPKSSCGYSAAMLGA